MEYLVKATKGPFKGDFLKWSTGRKELTFAQFERGSTTMTRIERFKTVGEAEDAIHEYNEREWDLVAQPCKH